MTISSANETEDGMIFTPANPECDDAIIITGLNIEKLDRLSDELFNNGNLELTNYSKNTFIYEDWLKSKSGEDPDWDGK